MAIEGPLRELGVHDVFQLLDLSRKSGRLRVTSALRGNEGTVEFARGLVVAATIRDNPHQIGQMLLRSGRVTPAELERAEAIRQQAGEPRRLGEILVAMGTVSQREMERQVRRQIEEVVFELMSWSEGFFSFEEGESDGAAEEGGAGLSTESLLMEAARRIDEWTRIADRIPGPHVVPAFAAADAGHSAALDLRPREWQVLVAIDGVSDVSTIAMVAGVSEFDAARIVYGLLATGVVRLVAAAAAPTVATSEDALVLVSDAREAVRDGRHADALAAAERAMALAPAIAEAHALAGEALAGLDRVEAADAAFRRALALDGTNTTWLMTAARIAIRNGDLAHARKRWREVTEVAPHSPDAIHAGEALRHADRLGEVAGVGDER
ncbi:MAG TPA: DUF4388 domain-containing protein [Gemmatimonadaceae bacterium]